jgi:hypothetical protein
MRMDLPVEDVRISSMAAAAKKDGGFGTPGHRWNGVVGVSRQQSSHHDPDPGPRPRSDDLAGMHQGRLYPTSWAGEETEGIGWLLVINCKKGTHAERAWTLFPLSLSLVSIHFIFRVLHPPNGEQGCASPAPLAVWESWNPGQWLESEKADSPGLGSWETRAKGTWGWQKP